MKDFKVSVVLPSHNEELNIPIIAQKLVEILSAYFDYEIIFIDDGSKDNSRAVFRSLRSQNPRIKYISFARNFGHQNALRAGLDFASGDCVICMDADMQHPPEMIPTLIEKWLDGYDIVYTIRKEDPDLSFFKKFTSNFFYKLINRFSDLHIEKGAADFRLMDKIVVEALREYREKYIFYRGIISALGFNQFAIPYEPQKRLHGKSGYTFMKMLNLALSGLTGFSTVPLHLSTLAGMAIAFFSFLYAIYAVVVRIFFPQYAIEGWSSLMTGVFFLGGVQLIMIGILGEYIGKLFFEVKQRPNYIIKEKQL